ncbi:MAG: hypothetical protein RR290_03190 [Clostridia bacterium]
MKKGVTLVSLVLYVFLFFTFTTLATAISTNQNHKVLSEKGRIIINNETITLYSNLLYSAKKSISYDIINEKIVFSNGDYYSFENNCIYKNSGKLVDNITSFVVKNIDNTNNLKCFQVDISLKKYNEKINKNLIITVGDELYEK